MSSMVMPKEYEYRLPAFAISRRNAVSRGKKIAGDSKDRPRLRAPAQNARRMPMFSAELPFRRWAPSIGMPALLVLTVCENAA